MSGSGGFALVTPRLRIRPWTTGPDDVAAAFAMYGDPQVTRYLGDGTRRDSTPDVTRAFLERVIGRYASEPRYGLWAVEERARGEVIGSALFRPLPLDSREPADIEIGYHLRRSAWGQGYATEIAIELIRHGLHDLVLDRMIAVAYPANAASLRVLAKAIMTARGMVHAFGQDLAFFVAERTTWSVPGTAPRERTAPAGGSGHNSARSADAAARG